MNPKVILTFDIENWFDSRFLAKYLTDTERLQNEIQKSIELILQELSQHHASATFFVLGKVAQKYPKLIKKIYQCGHEIASHGYSHKCLDELSRQDFETELIETNKILKDITGVVPKGFRAPAFSLNRETCWAQEILKKNGFQYDSSVFPKKMGVYGDEMKNLPQTPGLTELPVAIYKKSFLEIPIAGGIYFRFLPYWIFKLLLRLTAKKEIPVIYFHNHELIACNAKIPNCPFWKKWLKFKGVKNNLKKFKRLLNDFDCVSVQSTLNK